MHTYLQVTVMYVCDCSLHIVAPGAILEKPSGGSSSQWNHTPYISLMRREFKVHVYSPQGSFALCSL